MRSVEPVKIVVVVDPVGRRRGVFWKDEIELYNAAHDLRRQFKNLPEAVGHWVPVADDVMKLHGGPEKNLIHLLPDTDVIIFNWDVLNDDPTFGADVTARWTRHYRTNLQDWVYAGGVLVIEGQANRSIPVQAAYDAILGDGELRLSGEEDPLRAGIQVHEDAVRTGIRCEITRRAKASALFRHNHGTTAQFESVERRFEDYFPLHNPALQLPPELKKLEPTVLWRGWFRHRGLRRRRFSWLPLLQTSERGIFKRPTLLAARHGDGAIFVSTMHLALGWDKPYMLAALVRTHRDKGILPSPGIRVPKAVDRPTAFAVLATLLYFVLWPALFDGNDAPGWLKGLGGAGLSLAAAALGLRRWFRREFAKIL